MENRQKNLVWITVLRAIILALMLSLVGCSDYVLAKCSMNQMANGCAYGKGKLSIPSGKLLIVPENTEIRQGAPGRKVTIFTEKTLSFAGITLWPISIYDVSRFMGCVWKKDEKTVTIATYGEWDTRIEGEAFICLIIDVPEGVKVETRQGLSGPDSESQQYSVGCQLYNSYILRPGWKVIPTVPDFKMTAEHNLLHFK